MSPESIQNGDSASKSIDQRGMKRKRLQSQEHGSGESSTVNGELRKEPSTEPSPRDDQDDYPVGNFSPDTKLRLGKSISIRDLENRPHGGVQASQDTSTNGRLRQLRSQATILRKFRQQLPIWPSSSTIRSFLQSDRPQVLILTGETGSGKSTQVPQFLLSERWCRNGCIAVTEPRRVAAIGLAKRVGSEMGVRLGKEAKGLGKRQEDSVGWSVRLDNNVSRARGVRTRIKYLTEGMLLRELLRDPYLESYAAVIVDEVHERSIGVDLLLGFLRLLLFGEGDGPKRKNPLKLVVMSATTNVESLKEFFSEGCPDRKALVEQISTEEAEGEWEGFSDAESEAFASKKPDAPKKAHVAHPQDNKLAKAQVGPVSSYHVEGRQYPVKIVYLNEPTQDFVESALSQIFEIHRKEPLPGDILVFLTGQDTIESLERLINQCAQELDRKLPRVLTLPLFAALPQAAQQRVFERPPSFTRKVILSTNLAETSITVPGVRYVVDSGKVKVKQYRSRLGLDSLLVKPISRSSSIQRQGRAGREAPGICYRLYTEPDFLQMENETMPEILRSDLSGSVLSMKACGISDVAEFPLLSPPPRDALEKALIHLLQLGALNDSGDITEVGKQMSKMPLSPNLARIIIEASQPELDCLEDVIDIIACLSVENIFINVVSDEKREQAHEARQNLYRREGDHLTMLATVQAYLSEHSNRKAWAEKYFVSHRAMQSVMDIRKQLLAQCVQMGLSSNSSFQNSEPEKRTVTILRCLLKGFMGNIARLMPDGSYRTILGNQTVAIHPSSVLFSKKVEAIMFSEFVFTNKSYARGVSSIQMDWIGELLAGSGI
ncbi:P-loop containing nucleoside triphosphate hydrolase protein [Eremomyces bilateralis CBS 781.70]|uniref:RNA helicase n=1 Tax=Eremomyces bilateralis CBS 781.70 TaxID=1392243 RepID=A0A6G1FQW6_9PEZI|nr:P-loop containing nucleoside triphosphate hydrolase protein [Eremomyces bilateralis CBS 781.70]KAF1808052.1 P-loop containing nucleoside triphosphate hydrolase protein [Eremomyces bilateralis CBS 781.70]